MPSLVDLDPQGELVRRITAIEAEQRRIGSLRKRPAVNMFAAKSGTQAIAATTTTKVTGWSLFYTNPADSFDAATGEFTAQSPGMYLVTACLNWTATADQQTLVFFSETSSGYLAGSGWTTQGKTDGTTPLSCITQLDAGVAYALYVYRFVAGGTIAANSTFQIHRLSDVPANT